MRASNGKWYVRFVVDGVEYSQPTGLEATERNKKKVQQMEAAARQLVREGKANLLRLAAIPFSEAAAQFLNWAEGEYGGDSRKTYLRIRSSFSYAQLFFGKAIVSAITTGHIDDFKSARRKMNIKEISLRHDLHNLSIFWQYAVRKNWARENIIRSVSVPSGKDAVRMNVLSPEQERLYFANCKWMDRAAQFIPSPDQNGYRDLYDFMRLMIQQGTRPEELMELRKEDVDLTSVRVSIQSGKTEAARRLLRLTGESAEILKRRMSEPGPFIFPSPKNPARHRGLTWRTHESVLEAMKGRPGACVFVPYDLRHTAATRWATDGMPVPVLAATLGHANLRSVMKYIHITADNIEREMVRIEKIRLSRTGDGSEPISSFDQDGKERRTLPAESGGTSSTTDPCFGSGDSAADLRHRGPAAIGRGTK
jgi:integrase